jgi:putative membrane protein
MSEQWERPHPRSVAVGLTWIAGPLFAIGLGIAAVGGVSLTAAISLGSGILAALVVAIIMILRATTTRYRVAERPLEIHSGLMFRRHRLVPVDRVRTVDLTADPVRRIFGLTTLTISTGEQAGESSSRGWTRLDGITRAQGERLRALLLQDVRATGGDPVVARMNWAWIRFAALTPWSIGGVGVVVGGFFRLIDTLGIKPQDVGFLRGAYRWFDAMPVALAIGILVAIVVVTGCLGATAMYVESWWNFRLLREETTIFKVLRGLVTTRSVSIRRDQIRGAQLAEPLLLRLAGGARANAIAVGLGSHEDNSTSAKSALLPPAPRQDALDVTAVGLGLDTAPMADVQWACHPRPAARRRIGWVLWWVAPPLIVLAAVGAWLLPILTMLAWILAAIAVPAGVALAVDAYRSLGSALSEDYLLTRSGTFTRRSVALRRRGIIGWTISQSPFQRRNGLITIGATTAAGKNIYRIRDAAQDDGLSLTDMAVPGLLVPFLADADAGGRNPALGIDVRRRRAETR